MKDKGVNRILKSMCVCLLRSFSIFFFFAGVSVLRMSTPEDEVQGKH